MLCFISKFIILSFVSSLAMLAMTFTCYTILFVVKKLERITPTWYKKFVVTNVRISFHQCLHLVLDFFRFLFWANTFYLQPVEGFNTISFKKLFEANNLLRSSDLKLKLILSNSNRITWRNGKFTGIYLCLSSLPP